MTTSLSISRDRLAGVAHNLNRQITQASQRAIDLGLDPAELLDSNGRPLLLDAYVALANVEVAIANVDLVIEGGR